MDVVIIAILIVTVLFFVVYDIERTYDKAFFYLDMENENMEKHSYTALKNRHDMKLLFCPFQTVPTKEQLEEKLQDAYDKGCRYMFGFIRTSMLMNTLDFATNHPDVKIYSIGSTATFLKEKPSNVFRYVLNNDYAEKCILSYYQEKEFEEMYIFYDINEPFCVDIANGLKQYAYSLLNLNVDAYGFDFSRSLISAGERDSMEMTIDNLRSFLKKRYDPSKTLISMFFFSEACVLFMTFFGSLFVELPLQILGGDSLDDFPDVMTEEILPVIQATNFSIETQSAKHELAYVEADGKNFTAAGLDILDFINGELPRGATLTFDEYGDRKYGMSNVKKIREIGETDVTFVYEESDEYPLGYTSSLIKSWS